MSRFAAVLMVAIFMNACSGGGDGNGAVEGPAPPTPAPVGTAARLVALTISMPTPTTVFGAPGTAAGKLAVNMDTGEIGGAILFSGLSSSTLAGSIRDSTAVATTPPIVSLASGTGTTGAWVIPANTVLDQLQLSALATGALFFRIDTVSNQSGDKRGEIVFPNITITTPMTPVERTGSTGGGTGTLTLNLGTGTISGSITFSGLTSNATAAHIHLWSDNSVIVTLEGGGAAAGTFTIPAGAFLNAPQLRALVNNGLYFTVNSQNFQPPVSELIGNIDYPVTTIPNVSLSGIQEVPPVTTVGSGTGSLTVSLGTGKLSGSVAFNTPSSIADRAHIHQGFAGENGPILVTLLGGAPGISGTWAVPADTFLSAERLGSLISDRLYVNVHTAGHPDGEIRGQIRSVPAN
jgi:CHRD domain